jgi:hypothetical protein
MFVYLQNRRIYALILIRPGSRNIDRSRSCRRAKHAPSSSIKNMGMQKMRLRRHHPRAISRE